MDYGTIIALLESTIRLSTPLILACLAGLFSERSGIFDIGLEGKMLIAAFASASTASIYGSAVLGVGAGILASVALAVLHGFASVKLKGNQLISGVAINFFAAGISVLIGLKLFRLGGQTPQLRGSERLLSIDLPFAETLGKVPVIGPIYEHLISGHNIVVYAAFLAVPISWWILYRTRFGLRLRGVGEAPAAVDTAGISVVRLRYSAVIIAGILCGLAGAYLSMGTSAAGFVKNMTAGKGFIALAALIFAKWMPWNALYACLLFGLLEAVSNRYQNISFWQITIPVQFMQALPYILTVVILAGFVGKAVPPRAGGIPYSKER
jgi:general nucleoside transport system permease protein